MRGYSFFGDSFVYVLFDDDTDLYWAPCPGAGVFEPGCPQPARLRPPPALAPDATGWAGSTSTPWWTEPASTTGELTSLQNWLLKFELQTVDGRLRGRHRGRHGAPISGAGRPDKLRAYGIPLSLIETAIQQGNQETGASVIEMAEAEVHGALSGYLKSVETSERSRSAPMATRRPPAAG